MHGDDAADDAYDDWRIRSVFRQNVSGAEWYKVVNSGSRDHIATRTDGRFMLDTEDREISEGIYILTSKMVIYRRFSFTAAIYNHLSYQYSTKRLQQF